LEKNKVYLQRSDNKEVGVVLDQLYPDDALKAQQLAGEFDDIRQLEVIEKDLNIFVETADASLDGFLNSHRKFERAPYSGLVASFILARDRNNPEVAGRTLDEVISRLTEIRKYSPQRHGNTLTTALNNRAIIYIKEKAFMKAAIAFTKALKISKDNDIRFITHNASLLLGWVEDSKSGVEITDVTKKGLITALQDRQSAVLPDSFTVGRLCYSINFDRAAGDGEYVDERFKFVEIEDNCILCGGDGHIDCQNCRNGIATFTVIENVGRDPITGTPINRPASREKPCENCQRFWGDFPLKGVLPCPYPECDNGKLRAPK
jgi:tetratricopeptide (TPR) repeat protein